MLSVINWSVKFSVLLYFVFSIVIVQLEKNINFKVERKEGHTSEIKTLTISSKPGIEATIVEISVTLT